MKEIDLNYAIDTYLKQESIRVYSIFYHKSKQYDVHTNTDNHFFDRTDDINNITGIFEDDYRTDSQLIGTALIEFLNLDFNNFTDFFTYFSKYFGVFMNSLDSDQLFTIYSGITHEEYDEFFALLKSVHTQEKNKIKKIQKELEKAISYIYNLNNNEDLEALSLKQRFYVFQTINNYNMNLFDNLRYKYSYSFVYPSEFYKNQNKLTEKKLINKIKEYDPDGTKLTSNNYYECPGVYTMLYISLYNIVFMPDTYIKICKNCNRYFITSKSNTVFCENIFSDNKSCREIGNQLLQKKKEREESVYGKYRKMYAKKAMMVKRNPDINSYKIDYDKWKKEAKQFLTNIKNGTKTYEQFEKWLNKNK